MNVGAYRTIAMPRYCFHSTNILLLPLESLMVVQAKYMMVGNVEASFFTLRDAEARSRLGCRVFLGFITSLANIKITVVEAAPARFCTLDLAMAEVAVSGLAVQQAPEPRKCKFRY